MHMAHSSCLKSGVLSVGICLGVPHGIAYLGCWTGTGFQRGIMQCMPMYIYVAETHRLFNPWLGWARFVSSKMPKRIILEEVYNITCPWRLMQKKLVKHEIVQNYAAPWRRLVWVILFNVGGYGIIVPY